VAADDGAGDEVDVPVEAVATGEVCVRSFVEAVGMRGTTRWGTTRTSGGKMARKGKR
jgi:hypothetical protein